MVSVVLLLSLGNVSLFGAPPKDYTIQVEATVTEDPVSIKLTWPLEPAAAQFQVSRKLRTEATWTVVADLPGSAFQWTDTSVTAGVHYEYRVWRPKINGALLAAFGYISAGIRVATPDHSGTVILIVDDSMSEPLSAELARLTEDLVGDGWKVIRHDVSRFDTVASVKALIVADYLADPIGARSVFLFGHIPVPYSGNTAYDGHPPGHQGAWVADLYYGDIDGVWTDSTVNNGMYHDFPENDNVPGDGKFDQNDMPGVIELEVGRVDLSNMPAFAKNETELLRQYLDKDHAHRHALRVLPKRALIDDRFGEFSGEAFAVSGWRASIALVGAANTAEGSFGTLSTEGHLFYYLCGGGWLDSCDSVNTAQFASSDPQAAFTLLFGSWFGDWDKPNNFLRAPLATTTGLTSAWAGRPPWFIHTMALGGTVGEAARVTQNNRPGGGTYVPMLNYSGGTHVSLMGDPTLRLLAVIPPTGLNISEDENHPALSWTASADASLGYHIYRSPTPDGPFTRLTPDPITQTNWTDASVSSGTYYYQVKAVKLETSPGGTYINLSQALAGTIGLGSEPSGLTGAYYNNMTLTAPAVLTRVDNVVDFEWGNGSPNPLVSVDGFSARWTGRIQAQFSETYTFYVSSDDGARLWVNNVLIIDHWIDQGPTEWSGSLNLTAGSKYDIRLEYYENGGGAVAHLSWSSASTPKSIIPMDQLFPTSSLYATWVSDNGLSGDDALPESDPDKNGLSNLTEYAFAIPHGAHEWTGLPTIATSGSEMTLTYRPLRSDLTYTPVWSTNLINWYDSVVSITFLGDTATAHLPLDGDSKKFMRLNIIK